MFYKSEYKYYFISSRLTKYLRTHFNPALYVYYWFKLSALIMLVLLFKTSVIAYINTV